jgi:hypothetical protein
MDKELRYGRVEIVESTTARVHVRWRYQSTDLNYKVWGDEAVEDYYFYPDGFGTRVLTLKSDPAHDYEVSEFIILTPQGAHPFDVLPDVLAEAVPPAAPASFVRVPIQPGKENQQKPEWHLPAIYRLFLSKEPGPAAIYFNPLEKRLPSVIFAPFSDRGEIVTPCYWGSHWPLARGNATGYAIDDRIALTPCHNSVMSWAGSGPPPVRSSLVSTIDALGRSRTMQAREWVWLIGMSDAADEVLSHWASSFKEPPSIEIHGGKVDFDSFIQERRALRLRVQGRSVSIKLKPASAVMNPVFELLDAPAGPLTVSLDGSTVRPERYAWDGHTLWLEATIERLTDVVLGFDGKRTAGAR